MIQKKYIFVQDENRVLFTFVKYHNICIGIFLEHLKFKENVVRLLPRQHIYLVKVE